MTIEGILDHDIKNKGKIYLDLDQQLLIDIRSEEKIRKSRVLKAIKIGFALFGRRNELVISLPTWFAANNIDRNTVYTVLGVNN